MQLPYPARNELRGHIRRYLELNEDLMDERRAWRDLALIARAGLAAWTAEPLRPAVPETVHGELSLTDPQVSVAAVADALAQALCVDFSQDGGPRLRTPKPLRLPQNSWPLHSTLRSVLAEELYDTDQMVQNLWHWHLGEPKGMAEERAACFVEETWPGGALTPLVRHDEPVMAGIIALVLRRGAIFRGRSQESFADRARQWLSLFGRPGQAELLTTARDPNKPENSGTVTGQGFVSTVTAVIGFAGARVGILLHQRRGIAD